MVADSISAERGYGPSAATPPNKSLEGHKLLFLTHLAPPEGYFERLHAKFPGLKTEYRETPWPSRTPGGEGFTDHDWKDVTILLTGNAFPSSREIAPKLQYVQLQSAGANMILKHPLFTDTDVVFATANGVHGPQITEWVIATFLAFQHQIPTYLDIQRQGTWKRLNDEVEDAVGRRVGILGYGSIGRQVARVAKALGSDIHAYTLHPKNTPESRRDDAYAPPGLGDPEGVLPSKWFSGETKEEIHEFLSSGLDLLVVSVPLTDKTHHLLSAPEFEILKAKRTYISNIARGPIINTDDLIEALDKGLIRGAALDVTDPEPLPDGHPLWKAKNVIITPHISGASTAYTDRLLAILENNLTRLSEGKELTNKVSRRDGY
ncbi:D-isomer specific 2-hydroxyacid dehydrogenase [Coniochaeta ligniaria NRRL 30616]|uniref:D-isomer specific 2-hydroxyacid dehydrogenase n=1 Tax=Coniochaeta ligniaria NRRL 30616 TaxID=1408157 RepID=A0A1J7J5G0_9PEZI|nr:D-isomer specific 2-hydroxyacid dehydrogenase [Coniochaeta ligniaria NRRL 30616]